MEEKDLILWEEFRQEDGQPLSTKELQLIGQLHAKYYNHSYELPCTCNAKGVKRMIDDINYVYVNHGRTN